MFKDSEELINRIKQVVTNKPNNNKNLSQDNKNLSISSSKADELSRNSEQNKKIDPEKRQNLINALQKIADKASARHATSKDAERARELNEALGGEFSGLVEVVAMAAEQAESANLAKSLDGVKAPDSVKETLNKIDDYFKSVSTSEVTLRKMEKGEVTDLTELQKSVEELTSEKDKKSTKELLKELEEKEKNLYKAAISEHRSLSEQEEAQLQEMKQRKLNILKREGHRENIISIIGEENLANKTLREQAVAENKPIIEQAVKAFHNNFVKIEQQVEHSMHALREHVVTSALSNDHNIKDKNANLENFDRKRAEEDQAIQQEIKAQMAAIKQEVKKEEVKTISTVTKEEKLSAEKSLSEGSHDNKAESEKAAAKTNNQTSIANKLAALKKAQSAQQLEAIKASAPVEEINSALSVKPNSTPNANMANRNISKLQPS